MALNPKAFGPTDTPAVPQTQPAVSRGFAQLTGSRAPELGGDVEAVRAMRQLPTFRPASTETDEPESAEQAFGVDAGEIDFNRADEVVPEQARQPQARTGLERLTPSQDTSIPILSDVTRSVGAVRKGEKIARSLNDLMPSSSGVAASLANPATPQSIAAQLKAQGFDVDPTYVDSLMRAGQLMPISPVTESFGDIGAAATGGQAASGVNPSTFSSAAGGLGALMGLAGLAVGGNTGQALGGFGSQLGMMGAVGAGGAAAGAIPALGFMGPFIGGVGNAIGRALSDVPHSVRERQETDRALGRAETMLAEVGTATTPEEYWAGLTRGAYQMPLDPRLASVDDVLAQPDRYQASIQAGVDPSFLADTNSRLTDMVRGTAALLNAARNGDPEAQAILQARGPQRQDYLARSNALLTGPTIPVNYGEGDVTMAGGGADLTDPWSALATYGGMRGMPNYLSPSLGVYNAARLAGLPGELFREHSLDELNAAYQQLVPQNSGDEGALPPGPDASVIDALGGIDQAKLAAAMPGALRRGLERLVAPNLVPSTP